MLYEFKGHRPVVDPTAFVHPQAAVTGNVRIGKNVYIGPGAAIRGDWGQIIIEDGCNVQESCTIHMFPGVTVLLKAGAHIGHGAIVHGATIGRNALIGMNSVIMDNVEIGDECIVGALTFIKAGEKVPPRSVVAGNPAKILREVSDEMLKWKTEGTALYQALPAEMRNEWAPGLEQPSEYRPWKEKLSVDDYLEMEEKSEEKHEYHKGEIFTMSGPKMDHARIVGNMFASLKGQLRDSGCEIFASDLRVYAESESFLTYPDLFIVCGDVKTRNNDDWNVLNPSVIVEVLSKSTMGYDRDKKFELYKGLTSLKEYILVDSRSVVAEQFTKKADGKWETRRYDRLNEKLTVATVHADLTLEDIYENVRFPKLGD